MSASKSIKLQAQAIAEEIQKKMLSGLSSQTLECEEMLSFDMFCYVANAYIYYIYNIFKHKYSTI